MSSIQLVQIFLIIVAALYAMTGIYFLWVMHG
jgi:hypothetical protein